MPPTLAFRAATGPVFLALCAVPLPILVLAAYVGFGQRITAVVHQAIAVGLGPKLSLLAVLFVALLLAMVAFAALTISQRLVIHLRQSGIAGRKWWGTLAFVPWEEIERARIVRLPFVNFLQLQRTEGAKLLVPLFLVDRELFLDALGKLAPADHPVLKAMAGLERSGKG